MKIVACIIAIISGVLGLFAGAIQSKLNIAVTPLDNPIKLLVNSGAFLFYLSCTLIVLGVVSLKYPKTAGLLLILTSSVMLILGNIVSAPFAYIAGGVDLFAPSAEKRYNTKKSVIIYVVISLLGFLFIIGSGKIAAYLWNKPHEKVEDAKGVVITAVALSKEYNANEKKADAKYLNKAIEVSGTISEVDKNQDGGVMLILQTDDAMTGVQCAMRDKKTVATKGQNISIKGFCSGNGITGVSLTDCVIPNSK